MIWLLGYRLMHRYVGAVGAGVRQIALAVIASALTAFAEAAWYGATTGVMWMARVRREPRLRRLEPRSARRSGC